MSYVIKQLRDAAIKAFDTPEFKEALADIFVEQVMEKMGGDRFYIKQPDIKQSRNESIREEANHGIQISELQKKYGLSRSQIYSIIGDGDVSGNSP